MWVKYQPLQITGLAAFLINMNIIKYYY
jgi:hypothetical protein